MSVLRKFVVGLFLGSGLVAGAWPTMAAAQQVPLQTTQFSKKKLKAGDARVQRSQMQMNLTINVAGRTATTSSSKDEHKRETVLKVNGEGVPIKLKVHYLRNAEQSRTGGQTKTETLPTAGKTYVLERRGDATVVTTPTGQAPPEDEVEAVKKDYRRFGKPDEVGKSLPTRPLKPGERIPEMEKALAESFADSSERPASIEKTKVVFRGREGGIGIFDVSLTMVMAEGPLVLRMPIHGPLRVRIADGWTDKVEMSGPIQVSSKGTSGPAISGQGDVRIVTTSTYP